MSDIFDKASAAEEHDRDLAIKTQIERAARDKLHPISQCYFCEAELSAGRLFCDGDCRDDYELEQRRSK